MLKSRRQAREAALRALYQIEVGKIRSGDAVLDMVANAELPADLKVFAERLIRGISEHQAEIEAKVISEIIQGVTTTANLEEFLEHLGASP